MAYFSYAAVVFVGLTIFYMLPDDKDLLWGLSYAQLFRMIFVALVFPSHSFSRPMIRSYAEWEVDQVFCEILDMPTATTAVLQQSKYYNNLFYT